jgi:hypothetical protein
MGIFGWSYPAGCNGPPDDEIPLCGVCGLDQDSCKCPECPVCKEYGNPRCQKEHGLVITEEGEKE